MAKQAGPSGDTRLSRERVLRDAVALADARGIESLSMRTLAQELDVGTMSLYHYVANKDELLNGIVDLVASEIESPPDTLDWKAAMRGSAVSAYQVLLRHRWAASLMLSSGASQARLRHTEAMLRCLRRGGFSAEMSHHAFHALEGHIVGFTLWEVGMPIDAENLPRLAASFLRGLARDDFPYLAEHIETHLTEPTEYQGSEFEFGLDLILDGLERIRASA